MVGLLYTRICGQRQKNGGKMYYFYLSVLLLGILICVLNLCMIITRQEKDDQGYLTIVMCVLILSLMSYIAEIGSTDLAAKMVAIRMELTADALANAFFLFYILRFCNYKMTNRFKVVIFILHIFGLSFLYLNDFHGLYYSSVQLVPQNGFVAIGLGKGPVYYVYMFYNFMHMIIYELACISRFRVSHGRSRKVFVRLILTGLAPYLSFLLYACGLTGMFDVTCVGFLIVGILITNTQIHFGCDNTVSLAKDKLISKMEEGLLVTDENDFFIYGNPAAFDIFPELKDKEYVKEKVGLSEFLTIKDNKIYHNQHVYECSKIPMIEGKCKVGMMYLLHEITKMERMVSRDSMTGLYNHKMFYNLLEDCITKCEEQHRKAAIAFMDIDDFKAVNDRFGHDNGDAVILQLASIMEKYTGEGVYACRYGGEEFAMIFEDDNAINAKSVMEKIQKEFREHHFPFSEEELTFSCAVRQYQYGMGMEEYFAQTDKLLYYIKRNGKKKVLEAVS